MLHGQRFRRPLGEDKMQEYGSTGVEVLDVLLSTYIRAEELKKEKEKRKIP